MSMMGKPKNPKGNKQKKSQKSDGSSKKKHGAGLGSKRARGTDVIRSDVVPPSLPRSKVSAALKLGSSTSTEGQGLGSSDAPASTGSKAQP